MNPICTKVNLSKEHKLHSSWPCFWKGTKSIISKENWEEESHLIMILSQRRVSKVKKGNAMNERRYLQFR